MSTKTHYTFLCAIHEDFGEKGWRLENMPAFDPLSGMAVAHDILEHRPNDDSTTGEIMALGAMMYVRENYYSRKGRMYTRPCENFHGELADLLLKIESGEWVPLEECRYSPNCDDVQDEIDEGIRLAKKYLRDERGDEKYRMTKQTERNVRGWLAEGYRRAVKRYKHVRQSDLLDTFCEIEEKADKQLKWAEEGYKLHVRLAWKQTGMITDYREPQLKIWLDENYGEDY